LVRNSFSLPGFYQDERQWNISARVSLICHPHRENAFFTIGAYQTHPILAQGSQTLWPTTEHHDPDPGGRHARSKQTRHGASTDD
jgi:hypothetical protein